MGSEQTKKESVAELLERLDKGVVPDEEFIELVKVQLDKHLQWGYKATAEEQLAFHLSFIDSLKKMEIAGDTEKLNSEFYEVPISYHSLVFGAALKQSACYFKHDSVTIDEAEIAMHDLYCERSQIKDGQTILDIGCGQGSLLFHIAQKFKNCVVTGITNSTSQKEFIEEKCRKLEVQNIEVILADITKYETEDVFDRILLVGTIEHMKNVQVFLKKVSKWMKDDGFLFIDHVCHKLFAEQFEALDSDDWYAELLFPKGSVIIHAASTILYFQDDLSVANHWILNGKHMAYSHERWLKNLLDNRDAAREVLQLSLGSEEAAEKFINHCRMFHLAMKEQFSYNNGEEWMISHLLFQRK